MNWLSYLPLILLAVLILGSAVYAFYWASQNGEFRDFDAQARSIFDASEPEGVQTDFFPGKAPGRASRANHPSPGPAAGNHPAARG